MKIGIGTAYYGGVSPAHRAGVLECQRAGILHVWLSGGAYPEMNLAEICRDALASELDVVVIIRHDVAFSREAVEEAARFAQKSSAIWEVGTGVLAFAAVPLSALLAMSELESRTYANTSLLDTGFSNEKSRPFASPWAPRKEHDVRVDPLVPGSYLTPEEAFIERAKRAGVAFGRSHHEDVKVPDVRPSLTLRAGDPERRRLHNIKHNYAFCVPTFGALDLHQQDALWQLEKAGCTILEYRNCPYIDQARSYLTDVALEMGHDGVFFIDHDIIFIPADALALIEEAEERQDVVSAVYCMRKTAHALIGAFAVPLGSTVGFFDDGDVYPAIYSGLGFTAIPKAVFSALDAQLPRIYSPLCRRAMRPYYALDVNNSFYSGEDASFCARVQGLTIKMTAGSANANGHDWDVQHSPEHALTPHRVWLDTSVRIFHRGSYDYGIEDHSIAVPRYAHLKSVHVATRGEVVRFLADKMSVEAQATAQGCVPGTEAPHGVLEERGPCLNCEKPFKEHVLVKGTERTGWIRQCPNDTSHQYVELLHAEHREGES